VDLRWIAADKRTIVSYQFSEPDFNFFFFEMGGGWRMIDQ
jgi:hypothetical protein